MVNLLHYIERNRIVVLEAGQHDEILKNLVELCLRDYEPARRERLLVEILRSGQMKDQPLGQGFAITHARLDDLPDIRMSIGLLAPTARFCRGAPAHTVFCTMIPADKSSHYLSFMARLSRLLTQSGAAEVFESRDADRIMKLIEQFET